MIGIAMSLDSLMKPDEVLHIGCGRTLHFYCRLCWTAARCCDSHRYLLDHNPFCCTLLPLTDSKQTFDEGKRGHPSKYNREGQLKRTIR